MKNKRVIATVVIALMGAFVINFTLFKHSVFTAEYFVPIIITAPKDAHVTAKLFIMSTHHRYWIPLIYHRVKLTKPYQVWFEVSGTDNSFTHVVVNSVSRIDGSKVCWRFDNLNKVMTFSNDASYQNPGKTMRRAWSSLPIRMPVTFQENRTISLAVNYTLFPGALTQSCNMTFRMTTHKSSCSIKKELMGR